MPIAAQLDRRHRMLPWVDSRPATPGWGPCETITLALYCATVAFAIHQHTPWADESQAWMLVHDVSLRTLLTHSLHYEGTPGLWHCLLKVLQLFHLNFTAARWVTGGIAAAGVAVLLSCAPFPRIVRLLLPFTFFLAYQDAVIARSYVLFAVFAFTAAAMLRSRGRRPWRVALVLGLMANISLHALLASIGLAIVAAIQGVGRTRPQRLLERCGPAITLLLFWAAAAASMAPAADVDFSVGANLWHSLAMVEKQAGGHAAAPPALNSLTMAGLPRQPVPVHLRQGGQSALKKLLRILAVFTYPLSRSRTLSLLLVALVCAQACLQSRRGPIDSRDPSRDQPLGALGLTPYLLLVVAFTSLYLSPRHTGMIFTSFVVSAWLTWPARAQLAGRRLRLQQSTTLLFLVVIGDQISWTLHAMAAERSLVYSPDAQTAGYLRQHGAGAPEGPQVAGFYYYSVGPLLYFSHNLYFNQPDHRYWYWSTSMRTYSTVEDVLARPAQYIVIGGYSPGPDAEITRDWQPNTPPEPGVTLGDGFLFANYFRHHGYHDAQLFCGHSWMRSTYSEQVCDRILERDTP